MWHKLQTYAAGVAVFLLGSACTGQREVAELGDDGGTTQVASEAPAPTAGFVGISDAVPLNFFDANTSAPDPLDPNSLVIGFDTGSDPTTLIARDFRASALPFSHRVAMDTISFTIEAPPCYFVSEV